MFAMHILRYVGTSLVGAALLSLVSLAPASAQSYGGNYNSGSMAAMGSMGYGSNSGSYGNNSGSYGNNSGSYGNSYDNSFADKFGRRVYLIRRGDTLLKIAARFGTTVGALLRANPSIHNPDLIFAGRFLVIPAVKNMRSYGPMAPRGSYGSGYAPAPGNAYP